MNTKITVISDIEGLFSNSNIDALGKLITLILSGTQFTPTLLILEIRHFLHWTSNILTMVSFCRMGDGKR